MKSQRKFLRIVHTKKNAEETSGYSYTNTRVKAMKAKLLKRDEFEKFLKMSVAEITRYLQDTEYNKEMTELAVKFGGINLIEYGLNRNLENTFARILNFALRQPKDQVRLYLRRYDISNIKTILRGKFSKISNDAIGNELVACGEFSKESLEHIVKESSTVEAAIEFFKDTEYYDILKNFSNDLTKLEDELDKFYYKMVLDRAEEELRDYIRTEIFVKNTLNKLRGKKANIKIDLLPKEKLMKSPYEEDSIEARVFMKRMLIQKALKMVGEVGHNIRPVLGYFVAKQNEIDNIRILTRGRHAGLGEEVVQRQLVI